MSQRKPFPGEPSAIRVLKFGGSSVSTLENWTHIHDIVRQRIACGTRPFVVCSAVSGISNFLEALLQTGRAAPAAIDDAVADLRRRHEALARDLGLDATEAIGEDLSRLEARLGRLPALGRATARLWAEIMAHGELLSTRLGAAYLRARGLEVEWLDARSLLTSSPPQEGAAEPQAYLCASCGHEPDPELRARLDTASADVFVTQGFIASSSRGETVLLGRGGSDTSAAYLASKLAADLLEIWTDVPGVFTANPNAYPGARLLRSLSCTEAEVIAALGGKVLHPRSLEPVRESGLTLRIGWTSRPDVEGTCITSGLDSASPGVKAVASRKNLCLITMRRPACWQPVGFMAEVASCFQKHAISMDLLASSPSEIRATIDLAAYPELGDSLDALMSDLCAVCEPRVRHGVGCVSLAGTALGDELPRIGKALALLEGRPIHFVSHAANDASLSYVVDSDCVEELAGLFHEVLLAREPAGGVFAESWAELRSSSPAARIAPRAPAARLAPPPPASRAAPPAPANPGRVTAAAA